LVAVDGEAHLAAASFADVVAWAWFVHADRGEEMKTGSSRFSVGE
jgi:hypothetical protein